MSDVYENMPDFVRNAYQVIETWEAMLRYKSERDELYEYRKMRMQQDMDSIEQSRKVQGEILSAILRKNERELAENPNE